MPEMKDLIAIFKAETEEHLTKLEQGLVDLEKQPENVELVRSLNREVHTLKGAARVFGFNGIQDIAHRIEDLFEAVAEKRTVFSVQMTERVFRGLDLIRTLLEKTVQEKEIDVDVSDLCGELKASASMPQNGRIGRRIQRRPKRKEGTVQAQENDGDKTVNNGGENDGHPLHETMAAPPAAPVEEYIRVPLSRVDKLLYLIGEVVIYKMKSSATVAQAKKLSKLSKEVQKSISGLSETIRKEGTHQDGEMTKGLSQCEAQVQKLREHALKFYDQVSIEAFHLDPVIDELQAKMKEIKMLPLSTIFDGFSRMVRDIASQQGKEVNLVISGDETELDKRVMEGIKNSLIHILRNCVDHGIEGPDVRAALGKERHGTIKVSAFHESDNVVITVADDGRGMDLDQIKEAVLKKRLISRSDLERMAEKEILNLVFLNGYSTSPVVTDVSGRGMGLDIVRRDITQLKGRVILDAQKERGTKFTLVLPLTIAVIQVLLVEAEKKLFAIPMLSITESVKVKLDEVSTIEGRMAISLREQTVPLVRLNDVLGLPTSMDDAAKAKNHVPVVIATSFDQRVGFIVDRIVGEQEVFIKSLGKHLGKVKNVSGAIILASGEVVVVLDVTDLIAQSVLRVPAVARHASDEKHKERRILVVEDAFSTRELEKSILENHGYLVDTAVDGLDALDRMAGNAYDLVVSDIEMPRMDGFELCRTLKTQKGARDIPFVMVTALQKEDDKRRGMELGADAYLVKSAFEQRNLLDTIERLVG
jgi:two-component system, chemotaxis family, sensor kinase CheA